MLAFLLVVGEKGEGSALSQFIGVSRHAPGCNVCRFGVFVDVVTIVLSVYDVAVVEIEVAHNLLY